MVVAESRAVVAVCHVAVCHVANIIRKRRDGVRERDLPKFWGSRALVLVGGGGALWDTHRKLTARKDCSCARSLPVTVAETL